MGGKDERAGLQSFLARVRSTLGHDLRTPLGTIVNYASVLEDEPSLAATDLRDLPRRIREQAMQSAEMLELLLEATLLAASPPKRESVDPDALLAELVADFDGETLLREPSKKPASGSATIEVEAAVVAFAWRAFLRVQKERSPRPLSTARASVQRRRGSLRLGLTLGEPGDAAAPVDVESFARGEGGELPAPRRLALRLSRDLVAARGGELELVGASDGHAAIYLNFPRSA